MYAVRRKGMDTIDESRRAKAQSNCSATTRITQYFVKGSGPHNLITCQSSSVSRVDFPALKVVNTSGWALIIACLLVRCGSSVYDQKNWSDSKDCGFLPEANDTIL